MINVLSDGGMAERDTDLTQVRGPRGEVKPLLLPSLVLLRRRKSLSGFEDWGTRLTHEVRPQGPKTQDQQGARGARDRRQ